MLNPYLIAGAGFALLAASVGGYIKGVEHGALEARVEMNKHLAADREFELNLERAARAKEAELDAAQVAVADAYEQGKHDAEQSAQVVVDDLRAGNLRLRKQWANRTCPDRSVPERSILTSELDETTSVREESAGRIVRAVAECDAQVRGLQQLLISWQELIEAPSSRR